MTKNRSGGFGQWNVDNKPGPLYILAKCVPQCADLEGFFFFRILIWFGRGFFLIKLGNILIVVWEWSLYLWRWLCLLLCGCTINTECIIGRASSQVHCSIIHNSQDVETTQVSIDGWMDKENVVCTYMESKKKKSSSEEPRGRMGTKTQTTDLRTQGGERVSWDKVREWHGRIYTTKCKIDS